MTFLITGAETNGAFFLAEVLIAPGGGPPPHIHRNEDESFYLLEGTLMFEADGKSFHASAGDFIHTPRGTVHCFKNIGKGNAKQLVLCAPAGLEKFFEETFDSARDRSAAPPPLSEAMIGRFMAAASRYGLEIVHSVESAEALTGKSAALP